MHLTHQDILETSKIKRLNIINSITGIKPGNLIGTKGKDGNTNLAVFSSIVHLGSKPPLLGFILRPTGDVPRHTYQNILDTGIYTINSIPNDKTKNAHYTSSKFEFGESEFEGCHFEEEYIDGFDAPFVKESGIKIGLSVVQTIDIELNGTKLVIGKVEHLIIDDALVSDEGYINLEKANAAGIGGLNSYYELKHIADYPYARLSELPEF
jgi:flavin reductase (DIM6/NTAB) family NADH-FMN oxidoreductase RutF